MYTCTIGISRRIRPLAVRLSSCLTVGQLSALAVTSGKINTSGRGFATRAEREARKAGPAMPANQLFQQLFDTIERATVEMATINPGFKVSREDNGLVIETGNPERVFKLSGDASNGQLCFSSPKHGMFFYKFSPPHNAWINDKDGHFLVELLTRDLIYYCKGYPTF